MIGVDDGEEDRLGACPECEVRIPGANLLIRYETADGGPRVFAECPRCGDVVHPE